MARTVDTFTTAGGTRLEKIEFEGAHGNTQSRWQTKGRNSEFRTEEQVQQLREQTRQRNEVRQQALENEFPEWDNVEGLNPKNPKANDARNNRIKAFMDNEDVDTTVRNNPLLEGQKERDKALEARARQILKEFEAADSQAEKEQIKNKYNLRSS